MYENNVMCHCGKKGCIETEISGSAVCRKLVLKSEIKSYKSDLPEILNF